MYFFGKALLLSAVVQSGATPLTPIRPRVEYTEGVALGIDVSSPRFSWSLLGGRDEQQVAYQLVITQQHGGIVWDSQKVTSNNTQLVSPPTSVTFTPDSSFDWSVRWWASSGVDPSPYLVSSFSTGIGSGTSMVPWKGAQWIVAGHVRGAGAMHQIRKPFSLSAAPTRAALYVACMGYYSATIDGLPVSKDMMLGDFTNFEKRLWYTTHNVTAQLQTSRAAQMAQIADMDLQSAVSTHALGFTLSGGWDSRHGSGKNGDSILVLLSVDLEGGGQENHIRIISDTSWKSGRGAMIIADIYAGESYNASRTTTGWDTGLFNESSAAAVAGGYADGIWTNCTVGGSPHNLTRHPVISHIYTQCASHTPYLLDPPRWFDYCFVNGLLHFLSGIVRPSSPPMHLCRRSKSRVL